MCTWTDRHPQATVSTSAQDTSLFCLFCLFCVLLLVCSCCFLLSLVASCCFLSLRVAGCCLLLLLVATRCVLLRLVASRCIVLHRVAVAVAVPVVVVSVPGQRRFDAYVGKHLRFNRTLCLPGHVLSQGPQQSSNVVITPPHHAV